MSMWATLLYYMLWACPEPLSVFTKFIMRVVESVPPMGDFEHSSTIRHTLTIRSVYNTLKYGLWRYWHLILPEIRSPALRMPT